MTTSSSVCARQRFGPLLSPSPTKWKSGQPRKPRLVGTRPGRQGPAPQGRVAPSTPPKCSGRRAPAAKTPRILYRGKSGSSSKMGRQGLGGAGAAGRSMQRSQSRSSLSASFEALAGYFPCMNSLEEEEEGETVCGWPFYLQLASRRVGGWRVGRGRELRVAPVCPLPSRGLCCGRETPRARRLSLGEVLGDLESSAGADLGNDFLVKLHYQVCGS